MAAIEEERRSRSRERRHSSQRLSYAPAKADDFDMDIDKELQRALEKFKKPCSSRKASKPPPRCASECEFCGGNGFVEEEKHEEVGRLIIEKGRENAFVDFQYDVDKMLYENAVEFKRAFSGYLRDHRCLTKGPCNGLQPFAQLLLMTFPTPLLRMMGRLTFYPRDMFESIIDFMRRYEEDHHDDPNTQEDLIEFFGVNGEFTEEFSRSTFHQREGLRSKLEEANTNRPVNTLLREPHRRTFHDLMAWLKPMLGPNIGFKPEIFCKTYLDGKRFSIPELLEAFEAPGYPQQEDMQGRDPKEVFRMLGTKARSYLIYDNEEELRIAMMKAREESNRAEYQPPQSPNQSNNFYFQPDTRFKRRGSELSGPSAKNSRTCSPSVYHANDPVNSGNPSPFASSHPPPLFATRSDGDGNYHSLSDAINNHDQHEISSSDSYPNEANTPHSRNLSPCVLHEGERDPAAPKEAQMQLNALFYSWSATAIYYDFEKRRNEFGTTLVNCALCSPMCEILILRVSPQTSMLEIADMGLPRPTNSLSVLRQDPNHILPPTLSDVLFFRLHNNPNSKLPETLRCKNQLDLPTFADVLRNFRVPVLAVADPADYDILSTSDDPKNDPILVF